MRKKVERRKVRIGRVLLPFVSFVFSVVKKGRYMIEYNPIAESNNFIILERYNREWTVAASYQSEGDLERELNADLQNQRRSNGGHRVLAASIEGKWQSPPGEE